MRGEDRFVKFSGFVRKKYVDKIQAQSIHTEMSEREIVDRIFESSIGEWD